jgi:two-component system, sensor histidine kinase and response regulator
MSTPAPPQAPRETILVVDDTRANVRLLDHLLRAQGYDVRVALNGEMALASVWEAPPDLILLDVAMPRMDGFEVCQALKADPRSAEIPIIFISAMGETEHKVRAFQVGGVDYVTKPFHSEEVLARVRTHLSLLRASRAQRDLNERLEQSNEDLKQFAYVASHDLKEPLRTISGFGEILLEEIGPQLNDAASDYLSRIQNSAERLRRMIDNLLDYSRISSQPRPFEPVNLGALAREVLADLELRIDELGATVELDDLPWVLADAPQMRQLLQNLIGNALKFHHPERPPVIRIDAALREGRGVISVHDNGIGFDEEHSEQAFQIFKRLHGRDRYEGTGIGLAVCRRIVQRHGGDIDVRSRLGEGSVFSFTLPVCEASRGAP